MGRPSAEEWFTPVDVARLLHVSTATVTGLLRSGELRGSKVGSRWRIRRSALDDYLDGRTGHGSAEEAPKQADPTEVRQLEELEREVLRLIEDRKRWRARRLKALGPMPTAPTGDEATEANLVPWFFAAMAWDLEFSEITLTPRQQAEAAYTPTGPSVEELEDSIREKRGLPPLDRETGHERWDLIHTREEREDLERQAREWAELNDGRNPQDLPFGEYLQVWRKIVGLVPAPPVDVERVLASVRAQLAVARKEVIDE